MVVFSDLKAGIVTQLQGLCPFYIPNASQAGETEFTGKEMAHSLI